MHPTYSTFCASRAGDPDADGDTEVNLSAGATSATALALCIFSGRCSLPDIPSGVGIRIAETVTVSRRMGQSATMSMIEAASYAFVQGQRPLASFGLRGRRGSARTRGSPVRIAERIEFALWLPALLLSIGEEVFGSDGLAAGGSATELAKANTPLVLLACLPLHSSLFAEEKRSRTQYCIPFLIFRFLSSPLPFHMSPIASSVGSEAWDALRFASFLFLPYQSGTGKLLSWMCLCIAVVRMCACGAWGDVEVDLNLDLDAVLVYWC
ncbi:hypothetical protein K438DRAFT_2041768 [Mycena galopus ATCC 62051]|nr:hypothetical protein K438DRAFT_2041768 [Mycena galopus ATCC 62051]